MSAESIRCSPGTYYNAFSGLWRNLNAAAPVSERSVDAVTDPLANGEIDAGVGIIEDARAVVVAVNRADEALPLLRRVTELAPDDATAWANSSAIMTNKDQEDNRYVIMPMRL